MYTKCRPLTTNLYILLKAMVQKETLFKMLYSKIKLNYCTLCFRLKNLKAMSLRSEAHSRLFHLEGVHSY